MWQTGKLPENYEEYKQLVKDQFNYGFNEMKETILNNNLFESSVFNGNELNFSIS